MHEARKRSVNNLQRVYTVVVSLAIAESLRRLLSPMANSGQLPDLAATVAVISMLVTVVPFYHGANRYLDSTYVTGERSAKSGALMLDFVVIFVEGLAFFVLSMLISEPQAFYTLLAGLFLLDAAWVWLTRLTSQSPPEEGSGYRVWALVNILAAILLLLSKWSNLLNWSFWKTETAEVVAVGLIVVFRTLIDYITVWSFYYPPTPDSPYIMPVPRPAIPPSPSRSEPNGLADIDIRKVDELASFLKDSGVPQERESGTHGFDWQGSMDDLANCYLAIVAICHQTSPRGEPRLTGSINGQEKYGWDYLKEKYLLQALSRPELATPKYWASMSPEELSALYIDPQQGPSLSRVAERTLLLNDLGRKLAEAGLTHISTEFEARSRMIGGDNGLLDFLAIFRAYSDPLLKKSMFFLALAMNECAWDIADPENLLSPIDYHELRGHLRIGTIFVTNPKLQERIDNGLPIDRSQDIALRSAAQKANSIISDKADISDSALHYLLWNVFRNCCPRDSAITHCHECGNNCGLPVQYRSMSIYAGRCIFSDVCDSANSGDKAVDPPYCGHYY